MTTFKQVHDFIRRIESPFVARVYNKIYKTVNPYHYVTVEKIASDAAKWCSEMSSDFDYVIAMPRSGLLIGSVVACVLGKPLTTPDQVIAGRSPWKSKEFNSRVLNCAYNKVLLVDDTIVTGSQMQEAKKQLSGYLDGFELITSALYAAENAEVDRFYKRINSGHRYHCEYALMHHKHGKIGYDIDGVLCEDWRSGSDRLEFLRTARPYKIPTYEIDFLCTGRHEKYREITENWLNAHFVSWKKLYMLPDNEEDHIKFKTKILNMEKPYVFVESNKIIAENLNLNTGIPVVCTDENCMFE